MDDTTEHNNQDLDEHEERSHDADSNPCFDKIPEGNPEDEPDPWVDYMTRTKRRADIFFCSKRNHVVDPQTEPDLLEAGQDDCQNHEDHWTKLPKQKGYRKQGTPAKRRKDEINIYLQPNRSNRDKRAI